MSEQHSSKRPRLEEADKLGAADIRAKRSAFLASLSRPVSPPNSSRLDCAQTPPPQNVPSSVSDLIDLTQSPQPATITARPGSHDPQIITSPFRLMRPRGLPAQNNVDTIGLRDILGDPLIREAWIFNFCFDVDWTMQHFDSDVQQLVKVRIVHGSWKREDGNRLGIEEDLKKWTNVQDIRAYLPDPFGTHHSKMIILFKHDDTAQIVIHTANMLEKDWEHMTQAAWLSPVLPLLKTADNVDQGRGPVGSGHNFKADFLRYIKAYGNKLKPLADQLKTFDFSQIRAALIASTPSKKKVSDPEDEVWGHLSLHRTLDALKAMRTSEPTFPKANKSHLVCQISSIATLPQTYLQETIYKAASPGTTSIIYPTPSDLRNALTGYATGGSIHTKIATAANQKQVSLLRPQLHRWGTQSANPATRSGRNMIPPHIKTYIKFTSKPTIENSTPDISWALLTSANLSQQAWGTIPKLAKGTHDQGEAEVHIQSFEIGVLVWPELFAVGDKEGMKVRMVPVFGKDQPERPQTLASTQKQDVVVGLRMPYDLPLTPYGADEMPWSPGEKYSQPDRLGRVWGA